MQCNYPPIQTAVIGDFQRTDFQRVIRHIREKTAAIYFDKLALFLQTDGLTHNYDLIFLLASNFSQYSPRDIQRLQMRWPFARIVMIASSLAEGERRTGWLPPDLIRCYWHQWETEVLPVFTSFCDRRLSTWGLPSSASDEERLLKTASAVDQAKSISAKSQPKTAVILADDPAMRELLVDWVTQKGFKAEVQRKPDFQSTTETVTETVEAAEILLDVTSEKFAETVAAVQFLKKNRLAATRLTVFYTGPRPDEIQLLAQAGADHIVAKPFFPPQ